MDHDAALTHYRGLLGRLEDAALPRPLPRDRQVRSLAAYDRALGEGRN